MFGVSRLIDQDYVLESSYRGREVRHYSFVLNNSEFSEKKVVNRLHLNASTEINLWLGESGNVIGLDFIQVKENTTTKNDKGES